MLVPKSNYAPLLLATFMAIAAGCSSPASSQDGSRELAGVTAWSPEMLSIKSTPGTILLEIDKSLHLWSNLYLAAKDETDVRRARAIEKDLLIRTVQHQPLLIEQLESGSPNNRQVAALALGFSRDPVLSREKKRRPELTDPLPTLLAALEDPNALVTANAAMGLGLLARKETPTGGLIEILQRSEEPRARGNAAWALKETQSAGADLTPVLPVIRSKLGDLDPGVRAHCALILAESLDEASIGDLSLMLYDPEDHVAVTASRALAYIGSRVETARGSAARALTASLSRVSSKVRKRVLSVLQILAGRNYADDDEAWIEWAHNIP